MTKKADACIFECIFEIYTHEDMDDSLRISANGFLEQKLSMTTEGMVLALAMTGIKNILGKGG